MNKEKHHIFFGKGLRKLSEFYLLYVYILQESHNESHGKFKSQKDYRSDYKEFYQSKYCEELGLNLLEYIEIKRIFNKNRNTWSESEAGFMGSIKYKLGVINDAQDKGVNYESCK